MVKQYFLKCGFLIFLSWLYYVSGGVGFICPGIVYGSWCYWTTTLEQYNDLGDKCAEIGGEFTYFPDIYTITNIDVLFDSSKFLQYKQIIYVNVTLQSSGVWVFKDGTEVPLNLWAAGEPPPDDNCPFMSYQHSKYKLRGIVCNQIRRGLCGRQLNVSTERLSVNLGRLNNNVGQTIQSRTITHCSLACFQTSWCRSCNYHVTDQYCELNMKTKEEDFLNAFDNDVNWNYVTFTVDY